MASEVSAAGREPEGGYRPERRVYLLRFEAPEMAGLTVRTRAIPFGILTQAVKLGRQGLTLDDLDTVDRIFDSFADALIEWNLLDEDGHPVPATADGLAAQDLDLVLTIIMAWTQTASVAGQSEQRSSRSEPPFLPQQPLSPPPAR